MEKQSQCQIRPQKWNGKWRSVICVPFKILQLLRSIASACRPQLLSSRKQTKIKLFMRTLDTKEVLVLTVKKRKVGYESRWTIFCIVKTAAKFKTVNPDSGAHIGWLEKYRDAWMQYQLRSDRTC